MNHVTPNLATSLAESFYLCLIATGINLTRITCIVILILFTRQSNAQVAHEIQFMHDGKIVYGTFTTPSIAGSFPTIIIAPGSGPNDRNGTTTLADSTSACLYPGLYNETLQPYKQLTEALVNAGFAVLAYDKLEYTYTPSQLGTITFYKLWLPVESAIEYIKTRSDVDTNCISLIGHSEGSSLIPYIARGRSDIKALISIAGPRTPLDSILAYQIVNIAHTCDDDTVDAQFDADQILEYFNLVRINHGLALPPAFGVPARIWYDYLLATEAVSDNYNLNDLPTLFIGLEDDINVPLSELQRFQDEITITEDFYIIPGLNHFMTPADDPNVSKVLTDTIVHWLQQQCMMTSISDENISESAINIFPNPFIHDVNISYLQAHKTEVRYKVMDVTGKIVFDKTEDYITDGSIHVLKLNALQNGIYILDVEIDGKHVQKVLIKK